MRRNLPTALQSVPRTDSNPALRAENDVVFTIKLKLECVTPVIGGGVESYVPDSVDFVRVPGIRGRLREFWRALEPAKSASIEAKALFEKEVELWGGVAPEGEKKARRSRVEVSVEVPSGTHGREYPAGWHEPRESGGFSALPKWRDAPLAYGCFPLQQSREWLNDAEGKMPRAPTRSLREGMRFELRMSLVRARKSTDPPDIEAQRLLGSLFCWIYLGGLGGRTTRGFGCLRVHGNAEIQGLDSELAKQWIDLFAGPRRAESTEQWLRDGFKSAGLADNCERIEFRWATLHRSTICAGPPQASAEAAHGLMLRKLQEFRQGVRFARNPGRGTNRPGQTRWPEANLLKRRSEQAPQFKPRWEHPPTVPFTGKDCAPRAAFGLPLIVSFKDRVDSTANATLEHDGADGGRWTSPVRLRSIPCLDGRWVPLVVALARRPQNVKINFKTPPSSSTKNSVPVRGTNSGAQGPVATFLDRNGGDAVDAFLDWLATENGFAFSGSGR
jgi:CRISPR-associated protein Cmr1